MIEIFRIVAGAGLAIVLYQSIGVGIEQAIARQNPPEDRPLLPGDSRR